MVRRLASEAFVAVRLAALAVAIVATATASVGVLYLLRSRTLGWPGPRVGDVLPLDELPAHADVPLALFLLAFAVAALVLGVTARALDIDGLSAALATGGVVAVWLYVTSALSIFVVRQVPFASALGDVHGFEAVYLGAALCATGAALIARHPSRSEVVPRLAIAVVALLGIVDLLAGIVPPRYERRWLLSDLGVEISSPAARTVLGTVGALLLISLAGLGRRSRRAASFAFTLALCTLVIRLVGGFSSTVPILSVLALLLLFGSREYFAFPGDPARHSSAFVRLLSTAVATLLYGLCALFINRTASGLPFHFTSAVVGTYRELFGIPSANASLVSGDFAEWFPWTLRAIAAWGLLSAAALWFAPWRHLLGEDQHGRLRAHGIVRQWGIDSLSPFTLRTDKDYFFFPEAPTPGAPDQVLIAYRALRGIALVSGDPIGPAEAIEPALRAFREYCAQHGWRIAILGASERHLDAYRASGLRVLYHGEEAVIDTETFSLSGNKMKSARQAAQRVARNGYHAKVVLAGDLSPQERNDLHEVETTWLAGKPRKGFVMELDELFRLDGDDGVFVIGRDGAGQVVGFLELAVCPASQSLSLSSMPRTDASPNGLNAFLIIEVVSWAAERGYRTVSLNFTPFARLMDPKAELVGAQRVERQLLLGLKRLLNLQLDNLLAFNRHFSPRWQRRYLVYERRRSLARVALVAMAAERYLPFTSWFLDRRRDPRIIGGGGGRPGGTLVGAASRSPGL